LKAGLNQPKREDIMENKLEGQAQNLKLALMSLPPTGAQGFEGLIAVTLASITGIPFRLAGSGSQFGIDGRAAFDDEAICFEGKRYDSTIPKDQIFTKLFELSIASNCPDIWVLGATSPVRDQVVRSARMFGEKHGIFVLILDWSETSLPPFAVALAIASEKVANFLSANLNDDLLRNNALDALLYITNESGFNELADKTIKHCNAASVGFLLAQKQNTAWFIETFSNIKIAKIKLGQPICPGEQTTRIQKRTDLTDTLASHFTCCSDNAVVVALGGEGNGKSWVIAQSWLVLENKPILLFFNPEEFFAISAEKWPCVAD
jgi:hypothetical protein